MDQLGRAVDGIGDVNLDGCDDYVIAAPGVDAMALDGGRVQVYSGKDGSVLYTLDGISAGDQFGYSVAGAGDVNGDSVPDIIVGAIGVNANGANSGAVYVLSGLTGSLIHIFLGDSAGDQFGFSVSGAGDINGDGIADLIVGAPGDDDNGTDSGSARVFSGFDGTVLHDFRGNAPLDAFGTSVSGVDDVNGDALSDVVVGSPFSDTNGFQGGAAFVFSGLDGTTIFVLANDDYAARLGTSVSGAGDTDGDGFPDIVVGAPEYFGIQGFGGLLSGSVSIFSGQTGAPLQNMRGDNEYIRLGISVADAGDFNGDGFADIVVGAPLVDHRQLNDTGSIRVYSGVDGILLKVFGGTTASTLLGYACAGIGDIDGDGLSDVIAGGYWESTNGPSSGTASVFSGNEFGVMYGHTYFNEFGYSAAHAGDANNDGVADYVVGARSANYYSGSVRLTSGHDGRILWQIEAPNGSSAFGSSVCGIGDINSDGHDDVVVGSPYWGPGIPGHGAAILLSGIDGSTLQVLQGNSPNDNFGQSLSDAGDVNGDSVVDLIVGAPTDNTNGQNAGAATVFSGADWSILFSVLGDQPSAKLGTSVCGAGDVQGDGFDDVIVGIPGDSTNGTNAGAVRVYSGVDGTLLYDIKGNASGDQFGTSVAGLGDINSDGCDDFIVGAPRVDANGTDSGQATVYSGFDGSVLYQLNGSNAEDYYGSDVAGVGDVNGDGIADFVVGAFLEDTNVANEGSATVYSGVDGTILSVHVGELQSSFFGSSVNSAGDLNQDGFADILIGAYGNPEFGFAAGSAEVILSETLPVLVYSSHQAQAELELRWLPSNNIYSISGILVCVRATPGGSGIVGVSLAPADSLIYGIPLLIAIDPGNLIFTNTFTFGASGELVIGSISRQNPYLAGSHLHFQFYETSPVIRSSNAIRLAMVP